MTDEQYQQLMDRLDQIIALLQTAKTIEIVQSIPPMQFSTETLQKSIDALIEDSHKVGVEWKPMGDHEFPLPPRLVKKIE